MSNQTRSSTSGVRVPDRQVSSTQPRYIPPTRSLRAEERQPKETELIAEATIDDRSIHALTTMLLLEPPVIPLLLPAKTTAAFAEPKQLALLLPAHNEELIIAATIRSAIAAGQAIEDIYVVNDNSS
ncbi:MAG TPA: hypothetical protein VK502_03045, partial [Candidatus Saccharimonadales bacterium]|nr:hypothetical protein [Candidatus Saccharimonadales bacterium]